MFLQESQSAASSHPSFMERQPSSSRKGKRKAQEKAKIDFVYIYGTWDRERS
jgi:hypothetical protein